MQNKFLSREDFYKFQEGPEGQRLGTTRNKGLKQELLPKADIEGLEKPQDFLEIPQRQQGQGWWVATPPRRVPIS